MQYVASTGLLLWLPFSDIAGHNSTTGDILNARPLSAQMLHAQLFNVNRLYAVDANLRLTIISRKAR